MLVVDESREVALLYKLGRYDAYSLCLLIEAVWN
jgi:hypothetical protein